MIETRRKPPNRRPSITHKLQSAHGKTYVTIGYSLETMQPCEVFISGPKAGSDLQSLLDDAGVLLSLALQYDVPYKQLLHSLHSGREEGAASLLGKVVELLKE